MKKNNQKTIFAEHTGCFLDADQQLVHHLGLLPLLSLDFVDLQKTLTFLMTSDIPPYF